MNFFVALSPRNLSETRSEKKSTITQATEAGKETEERRMRDSTLKHAIKTMKMPIGT